MYVMFLLSWGFGTMAAAEGWQMDADEKRRRALDKQQNEHEGKYDKEPSGR